MNTVFVRHFESMRYRKTVNTKHVFENSFYLLYNSYFLVICTFHVIVVQNKRDTSLNACLHVKEDLIMIGSMPAWLMNLGKVNQSKYNVCLEDRN